MFRREKDAVAQELEEYNQDNRSDVFEEDRQLYESDNHHSHSMVEKSSNGFNGEFNLLENEWILWQGKSLPGGGMAVEGKSIILKFVAVMWLGTSFTALLNTLFIALSTQMDFSIAIFLFQIPFILIGFYIFKLSLYTEKTFIITNQRIIVINKSIIRTEFLVNISEVQAILGKNNIGSVLIQTNDNAQNSTETALTNGFIGVYNPKEVYNILYDAILAVNPQK